MRARTEAAEVEAAVRAAYPVPPTLPALVSQRNAANAAAAAAAAAADAAAPLLPYRVLGSTEQNYQPHQLAAHAAAAASAAHARAGAAPSGAMARARAAMAAAGSQHVAYAIDVPDDAAAPAVSGPAPLLPPWLFAPFSSAPAGTFARNAAGTLNLAPAAAAAASASVDEAAVDDMARIGTSAVHTSESALAAVAESLGDLTEAQRLAGRKLRRQSTSPAPDDESSSASSNFYDPVELAKATAAKYNSQLMRWAGDQASVGGDGDDMMPENSPAYADAAPTIVEAGVEAMADAVAEELATAYADGKGPAAEGLDPATEPASPDDPPDVVLKGWLDKSDFTGRVWTPRYCVLTASSLLDFSSRTEAESALRRLDSSPRARTARLGGVPLVVGEADLFVRAIEGAPTPNAFLVTVRNEAHAFAATTQDGLLNWAGALAVQLGLDIQAVLSTSNITVAEPTSGSSAASVAGDNESTALALDAATEPASADDPPDVVLKGWLAKSNPAGGVWAPRYCVLTTASLLDFASHDEAQRALRQLGGSPRARTARLGGVPLVAGDADLFVRAMAGAPTPHAFLITARKDAHAFAAMSHEGMLNWVGALAVQLGLDIQTVLATATVGVTDEEADEESAAVSASDDDDESADAVAQTVADELTDAYAEGKGPASEGLDAATEPASAADPPDVVLKGWLAKSDSSGLAWASRFCVMTTTAMLDFASRAEAERELGRRDFSPRSRAARQGGVPLAAGEADLFVRAMAGAPTPHVFLLTAHDDAHAFATATHDGLLNWVGALAVQLGLDIQDVLASADDGANNKEVDASANDGDSGDASDDNRSGPVAESLRSTTDSATDDDPPDVVLKGLLAKNDSSGRTWQPRFCVLTTTAILDFASRAEADFQLRLGDRSSRAREARLGGVRLVAGKTDLFIRAMAGAPTPHVFLLTTRGNAYAFAATTHDGMLSWVGALAAQLGLDMQTVLASMTDADDMSGAEEEEEQDGDEDVDEDVRDDDGEDADEDVDDDVDEDEGRDVLSPLPVRRRR